MQVSLRSAGNAVRSVSSSLGLGLDDNLSRVPFQRISQISGRRILRQLGNPTLSLLRESVGTAPGYELCLNPGNQWRALDPSFHLLPSLLVLRLFLEAKRIVIA